MPEPSGRLDLVDMWRETFGLPLTGAQPQIRELFFLTAVPDPIHIFSSCMLIAVSLSL